MRKKRRLCLAIAALGFILLGCQKENKHSYFTSDLLISQSASGFFQETDYGYYYNDGNYFYYSDKEQIAFHKLCQKLQCTHHDQNCDAWSFGSTKVHFYNGRIIFSYIESNADGRKLVVASKVEDGSKTTILTQIELPPTTGFLEGNMHRNWYVYNLEEYDEASGKVVSALYLIDLEHPKEEPEIIYDLIQEDATQNVSMYVNSFVDTFLYFSCQGNDYRYDMESKELIQIQDDILARKGKFYTKDFIYKMDTENQLYQIQTETSQRVELTKDNQVYGPFFSDGTYIYRLNYSYGDVEVPEEENGIYIYDMEGKSIGYVKYSIPTDHMVYFVATETKVFVFRLESNLAVKNFSYFDKKEIKNGHCQWTDVLEVN